MIDPLFRVEVIGKTSEPQQLIYSAMHQDELIYVPLANTVQTAVVNKSSASWVLDFCWYLQKNGYPSRTAYVRETKKNIFIYMHREIFEREGISLAGIRIDHKNGNKLDNSRENLRFASQSQNMTNRAKPSSNTSGFKGVRFHKPSGKWQAFIKHNYRQKHLGLFYSLEEAAVAYNHAALRLHGDFAYLNEVSRG